MHRRKIEGTAPSREGVGNDQLQLTYIWMKGQTLRDFCRHSVGRAPGGHQQNFSESKSSSKVSQTSTGATTARSAKQTTQIMQGFQTVRIPSCAQLSCFRVQSATMRELDEDDSVESLKAKNQKVRKHLTLGIFTNYVVIQVSEMLGKIEEISQETKDLAGKSSQSDLLVIRYIIR